MNVEKAKEELKLTIVTSWISWCVENNVDWDKSCPIINDFGTRFEVQMPELLVSMKSDEEE